MPSDLARFWTLDSAVAFLNHGSFGACPRPVLEAQQRLRERLERQPVRFFVRDLEPLLDDARSALAACLGADPEGLVFVPNATTAVNVVLRSLALAPGDQLVVTDHAYNACRNALDFVAGAARAQVVIVPVPFPLAWTGSHDPTPYLCLPEAIRFLGGLLPGGWLELMARNRRLALEARCILCDALDALPPSPEEMVGALAAVPLPDGAAAPLRSPLYADPLQDVLLERYGIEVPIVPWPAPPKRLVRVSCQAYNAREDYERLATALRELTRG